jgi:hypothetical protein
VPVGADVVGAVVPGLPGGAVVGVVPEPGLVPGGVVPVAPPVVDDPGFDDPGFDDPGDVPRTVVDVFAPVAATRAVAPVPAAVVVAPVAPVLPVAPVAMVVDATAAPDNDNVVDALRATSTWPPSVASRCRCCFWASSARAEAAKPTIIATYVVPVAAAARRRWKWAGWGRLRAVTPGLSA